MCSGSRSERRTSCEEQSGSPSPLASACTLGCHPLAGATLAAAEVKGVPAEHRIPWVGFAQLFGEGRQRSVLQAPTPQRVAHDDPGFADGVAGGEPEGHKIRPVSRLHQILITTAPEPQVQLRYPYGLLGPIEQGCPAVVAIQAAGPFRLYKGFQIAERQSPIEQAMYRLVFVGLQAVVAAVLAVLPVFIRAPGQGFRKVLARSAFVWPGCLRPDRSGATQ